MRWWFLVAIFVIVELLVTAAYGVFRFRRDDRLRRRAEIGCKLYMMKRSREAKRA